MIAAIRGLPAAGQLVPGIAELVAIPGSDANAAVQRDRDRGDAIAVAGAAVIELRQSSAGEQRIAKQRPVDREAAHIHFLLNAEEVKAIGHIATIALLQLICLGDIGAMKSGS